MFNRRAPGFTLIEMIITIVIIGVGLAGILLAFDTSVKSSADPLIRKQVLVVAEEMMEEILLKPYAVGPGAISGCNRSNADDVADYSGYTDQPICDIDGTPVAGLGSYTVTVAQQGATLPTVGSITAPALKITVTVTGGGETITLIGWRTDYAS